MPDHEHLNLNGSSVLVTGGTGSFGQRCCRVLMARYNLARLIVFSRDETKQFEMMSWLRDDKVRYVIGDVRDKARLLEVAGGVDAIIHAAALKQVPQAEYNPYEYVKTNVSGTQNVIDVAAATGVKRVIHTSTDKAVNPVNLYGATKLCADKLFISANYYKAAGGTLFACTRMGNLIGSRGSVIPIFRKMSREGKVTITDPGMTRFWLSLDDAVQFVLDRLCDMRGGEIFVPRTGTMKLTDLVEAVAPGAEIEVIGIRPGEKLDEELISSHEARQAVKFGDYFAVLPDYADAAEYADATGSKPLPAGFTYTSTNADRTISVDEMRAVLAKEGV
ncbi:polysaccharide biosynthesis protein [Gemmatimonadota bacterium]